MNTEISNWTIRTLMPRPSMSENKEPFTGTYEQAKDLARQRHMETGRSSSVESYMTYWFTVTNAGEEDKNINA